MTPTPENSVTPWPAPDDAPLTPQQIDLRHAYNLLERAMNQVDAGETGKALLACRQALHLAPQSFPVHSLLAMLLRRTNELDEAILQSEKALALIPEHPGEQARLAVLKAVRDNAQPAPALQFGEWDQFRLELQREIKLGLMLESQLAPPAPSALAEPLSFANDPLLPEPATSPVFAPPVESSHDTPRQQPKRYLYLFCLAALAAVLSFLVVRNLQPQPAPLQPPAQSAPAVQSTDNTPPGEQLPQDLQPTSPGSEAPPAPTVHAQPPATQVPAPAQSAVIPNTPDVQNLPAPAPRPAVSARPQTTGNEGRASRTAIPVPASPAPSEEPTPRPRPTPREEEIGPRFSPPPKPGEESASRPATQRGNEDVGPRFSQP